jgi:exonuclease SbcC
VRPHSLTLQHFGPYAEHTVDLEPFHDAGLFLVHGDTGSGKSTLLDAMSWALYGRGLGDRATDEMLRNVAAPPDAPTAVTLDFSLGDRRYRVARSLEPERVSRRGTVTRARTTASLQCLAGDPRFEAVGGTRDVSREVGRLLHLPHEQFSRVIVLPQGEFRDLLLAPAERRERLLEHLFGTARYALIEEQLRAMDSSARAAFDQADGVLRALLDGVGAADLDDLDAKAAEAGRRVAESERAIAGLRGALEIALAARGVAAEVERRNAQRRAHRDALAALSAGAGDADRDRDRLARDESAARCMDALTRLRERDADLGARRAQHERARTEHQRLSEALGDPALSPSSLEAAESAIRAALGRAAALRAAQDEAERLAAVEREAAERALEADRMHAGLQAREHALAEAVRSLAGLDGAIAAHEAAIAEEPALRSRVDSLTQRQQRAAERRAREDGLRGLQRARRDALAGERDAEEAWRALAAQHARSEAATHDEHAALLAASLVAGEPCPVCGSGSHPAPRTGASGAVEAAVDADALALAAAAHAQAQRESFALQIRIEEAEAALRSDGAAEPVDEEALTREVRSGKDALAALRRRRLDLDAGRRTRTGVASTAEALRASLADDQSALAVARSRLATMEEDVALRRAFFTGMGMTAAAVADTLRGLDAEVAAQQASLRDARARREETARAGAAAEGALPMLSAEVERASAARGEAAAALAGAMSDGEFVGEQAIEAAVLGTGERQRLRASLEARARAEVAHREALETLGADEAEGPSPADDEGSLREQLEAAQRELVVAQTSLAAMEHQRRALLTAAEAKAGAEAQCQRVRRVSEVANGKGPTRVRLSRYVLLDLFDRVVASASAGLEAMSDGRFRLRRQERAQTGREFDLVVDDAYVGGLARPAASLSGGEVFLASLAMALGLGEVLQAWAGGIRVESLFVDEGFGALDEDTVERAIELLERLPQHARMVGVVSHVPELRKRIPARLEVLRGDHGSYTRCSLRHRGVDR